MPVVMRDDVRGVVSVGVAAGEGHMWKCTVATAARGRRRWTDDAVCVDLDPAPRSDDQAVCIHT